MQRNDFNLTRRHRQIDRTDALLGGFSSRDQLDHPLQEPTGEKTRKTYDFTKTYHVGLSCHDIQASQGTSWAGCAMIFISLWRFFRDSTYDAGLICQKNTSLGPISCFFVCLYAIREGFFLCTIYSIDFLCASSPLRHKDTTIGKKCPQLRHFVIESRHGRISTSRWSHLPMIELLHPINSCLHYQPPNHCTARTSCQERPSPVCT